MIKFISDYNPFKRLKSSRHLDEREQYLEKFETVANSVDARIVESKNRLLASAENLEATVREALERYDDYREGAPKSDQHH